MHRTFPTGMQSGVTTIELLMVLSVAALLSTIGIPSLRDFALQQRLRDTVLQLQLDVAYARGEAITRDHTVSICTSNTGTTCTRTGWESGWIIFIDSDADGIIDGADSIIGVGYHQPPGLTINAVPARNVVSINDRGGAASKVILSVCMSGLKGRELTIATSGYPRISVPSGFCG